MGSRGRSIRLRIYFLVAIPLVTMLGMFGYVAYSSVTNWLNLDRAPTLIKATSEPLTAFVTRLQAERRAAVVYLSQPTATNRTAYQAAVTATGRGEASLAVAAGSPTTQNATPAESAAVRAMLADVNGMTGLRHAVEGKRLAPLGAFAEYTKIITGQDAVFQAEASSMTDTAASTPGLGLIATVNAREDLSEQDALLAGALAAHMLTGQERVAFTQAAGRQQDDTLLYQALLSPTELQVFNTTMNTQTTPTMRGFITRVQQGVEAGLPLPALEHDGLSPATWQQLTSAWQSANYRAGTEAADITLAVDQQLAASAKNRVWETAAIGAAGLILTLLVTIALGRSVNRRLTALRHSALTLAQEQLPAVVTRLRRGESVDVAAEAPPLLIGSDEIGQVGQAIDAVRQTAIRSAVEEARVRQGVNDMFRNLARRNQSLLQRQLSVLDDMERRATDPDVLEDLFTMDHLTTRMRRHAEGLIILSGAPPGRSWSAPVALIDVMRGAVAEVEDYARVTVSTQSSAALAGSAVTDVIHLLAELIENATTLSPPFTQARMSGESVGNGFAIEIEDRGLGMTPQRLAELNERLANPPEINPANTEQLGLFVVGKLALRHGISVRLRPSPYGGTCAVVLIPTTLVVEEPAPIARGGAGRTSAGFSPGPAVPAAPRPLNDPSASRPPATPATPATAGSWGQRDDWAGSAPGPGIRISGVLRQTRPTPGNTSSGTPGNGFRRGRHGSADVPVVTGVPVGRAAVPPPSSFDVFTPLRRTGQDGATPAAPSSAEVPDGRSYPDFGLPSSAAATTDGHTDALPYRAEVGDRHSTGNSDEPGGGYINAGQPGGGDAHGLPRRVRQANLAPQLRASAAASADGRAGVPQATAASLTVMRNTLSAMQRGWQQGRSQAQRETEGSTGGD